MKMKCRPITLLACIWLLASCEDAAGCRPNFFKEDFEGYAVGAFPDQHPWGYGAGAMAKLDIGVVNSGCAKGEKCLKVNMLSVSGDPHYNAYVRASTGCYDAYPPIYAQFYVKYLYPDGRVELSIAAGVSFRIALTNIGNYGSVEVSGDPDNIVVGNGNIFPDTWYRIELMINHPKERTVNVRVYEADSSTPVAASTYIRDIPVNPIRKVGENKINFRYLSTYLFEHPNSDLDGFSFFIDDFAIGDDPAILSHGF